MIKYIVLIVLLFLFFNTAAQINGELLTIEDKKILKVWGSHYDRGYAHGYLLGDEIREIAVDYVIGNFLSYDINTYIYCRVFFQQSFEIEQKYITETEAMIEGMTDSGTNMYISQLNRNLDATDILMANSLVDLTYLFYSDCIDGFGCSSLSAWDSSTESDPLLAGNLVITRNMDWIVHQALLDNHLLIVNIPTEENEISWVSFSFAGMIGVLSGINSMGTASFMNVGSNHTASETNNVHPIFFSIRNGMEHYDYNSDGEQNELDVISSVSGQLHLTGSLVHTVNDPDAAIIETNNMLGSAVRIASDNTVIPADNLVATNHFRSLYDPIYCYRYNNFADSLENSMEQDVARNWGITTGAGGVTNNLHTIQYVPSTGLIKWSTSTANQPAYLLEPTEFTLDDLNPVRTGSVISIYLTEEDQAEISIYNIKGQLVRNLAKGNFETGKNNLIWNGKNNKGSHLVSGVYFYSYKGRKTRETGKLVILK